MAINKKLNISQFCKRVYCWSKRKGKAWFKKKCATCWWSQKQIQFLLLFLTLTHTISLNLSLTSILRLCYDVVEHVVGGMRQSNTKWRRKRRATYKTIKKVSSNRKKNSREFFRFAFFCVFSTPHHHSTQLEHAREREMRFSGEKSWDVLCK